MADLITWFHGTIAHIGLLGLAGLYVVKVAIGWVVLRWIRLRRKAANFESG